jgi:MoxR-like ATPase
MFRTPFSSTRNETNGDRLERSHDDDLISSVDDGQGIETLDDVRRLFAAMSNCCRTMVQGRDDVIALVLTALFADGHVLLEDHPGSGKTTLAKTLGETILHEDDPGREKTTLAQNLASTIRCGEQDRSCAAFRRIQFTPDLLPSDVTGVTLFDPETRTFVFRKGPIFANIVLADEINRTSPKVQAAILEAMAEKQVTADSHSHALDDLFFVVATQNPHDQAGTYPLPRAQLDRFMFKIKMTYLDRADELSVLTNWRSARASSPSFSVSPSAIVAARELIQNSVRVSSIILAGLVEIAQALRADERVALGISTRSLVHALPALQVWAMVSDREYVTALDIKRLAVPLFGHRLELVPGARNADAIVAERVLPIVEGITRQSLRP